MGPNNNNNINNKNNNNRIFINFTHIIGHSKPTGKKVP